MCRPQYPEATVDIKGQLMMGIVAIIDTSWNDSRYAEPAHPPESPIRSETNGSVLDGNPVTLVVRRGR